MNRGLVVAAVSMGLAACGPAKPRNPALQHASKAPAKSSPRKCPDVNNRDRGDPCSASYIAPYRPAFRRDKF